MAERPYRPLEVELSTGDSRDSVMCPDTFGHITMHDCPRCGYVIESCLCCEGGSHIPVAAAEDPAERPYAVWRDVDSESPRYGFLVRGRGADLHVHRRLYRLRWAWPKGSRPVPSDPQASA